MPFTLMGLEVCEFMKQYNVQLAYYGAQGQQAPIDQCQPGPIADTLEFPSAVKFKLSVKPAGQNATVYIERQTATWETGVRYLPWQPDKCTYVRMDNAAAIAFTGPLSGCNVYVAGPRTDPVLFHTNWNKGANDDNNNTIKETMTLSLLAANICGVGNNTLIGGRLERRMYSQGFYGFVFGVKENNDWKFYFNGTTIGGNTLRRIF